MKPLQKRIEKEEKEKGREIDLGEIGKIIGECMDENDCQILITIPKGTNEIRLENNIGFGPLYTLYFLAKTFRLVINDIGAKDIETRKKYADKICDIVKEALLNE